ncbi:hypothetical protein NLJ89_g1064 [Agrocybe chaxingu]|uniref:Uncharacterized protein n=1 Tax=Agrocybe chaxingu TaxID=84603 RepID=A0A9W8TE40_9AGAR|nr:hypothetical protein NLJ89_g1064 [Agrocybe chaxingu]
MVSHRSSCHHFQKNDSSVPLDVMKSVEVSIFLSARQDVVDILESDGKTCVLVKEAAASLYHVEFDTEAGSLVVHVVIMPKIPGFVSEEEAKATLIRYDPDRFKREGAELRYYEPGVIPSKKNWCGIVLIPTANPPPPQYESSRIQRLADLPVASPLSVISDAIAGIQTAPEKGRASKLLRLLEMVSRHELVTIDDEFHRTLLVHLERVASFSQEFQHATSILIGFCQGEHVEFNGPVIHEDNDEELNTEGSDEDEDTKAIVDLDLGSMPLDPPSPSRQTTAAGKLPSASTMRSEESLEMKQTFRQPRLFSGNAAPSHQPSPRASRARPVKAGTTYAPSSTPSTSSPAQNVACRRSHLGTHVRKTPQRANTEADNRRLQALLLIARRLVDILFGLGADCALFGGLASRLYGNPRVPFDIEMLVQPRELSMTPEALKRAICGHDSHLFFGDVLHFRVNGPKRLAPNGTFRGNTCKIYIMMLSELRLPRTALSPSRVEVRESLPILPYPVLLLHKIQEWDAHRKRPEVPNTYQRHRIEADVILGLLKLEPMAELRRTRPWEDRSLFSKEFMALSTRRVREFYVAYPKSKPEFVSIGF